MSVLQVRERGVGTVDGAENVDVYERPVPFQIGLNERIGGQQPGVVDQQVQVVLANGGQGVAPLRRVPDSERPGDDRRAVRSRDVLKVGDAVSVDVEGADPPSVAQQAGGGGVSDAAGGAGDDGYAAGALLTGPGHVRPPHGGMRPAQW